MRTHGETMNDTLPRPPFLLISINKTATSSMDQALARYFDEAALRARAQEIPGIRKNPDWQRRLSETKWNDMPGMKHQHAIWMKNHFHVLAPGKNWDDYFKFCFVRHPFDRLQSIYRYHTQKLTKRYPQAIEAGSFSAWLKMGGTGAAKIAMRDFVLDRAGNQIVDFIGHYETLQADWEFVLKRLDLQLTELPHYEGTRTRRQENASMCNSENLEVFLANPIWQGDLEYFGYKV